MRCNYKKYVYGLGAIILIIGLPAIADLWIPLVLKYKLPKENYSIEGIDAALYFITGICTAILAFIAWIKFGGLEKINKSQFLMRIDERWASQQILDARIKIHKIYLEVREKPHNKSCQCLPEICFQIGQEIILMSGNETDAKDFINVLNFLDFMETIGFLVEKDYVNHEDLSALVGESLVFNFLIFQPYILHKRAKHNMQYFYIHFERLYDKIK